MGRMGRSGSSNGRRYSPREKELAVRMVRALREELGMSQGMIKRVAEQLGTASSPCACGSSKLMWTRAVLPE